MLYTSNVYSVLTTPPNEFTNTLLTNSSYNMEILLTTPLMNNTNTVLTDSRVQFSSS